MKQFELPSNDDFEKILEKNIKHTNPLEMKEKEVSGEKTLFPFWKPVESEGADTFYDYQAYLDKKEKKLRGKSPKDKVGVVKPASTFKTNANGSIDVKDSYEDYSIVGQMQGLINKMNGTELADKTGVVSPASEAMPKKSDSLTQGGLPTETEVKDSKADKPKGDNVGAVKPKSEGMPKGKVEPITTQDGIVTKVEEESHADKPKGDNVGAVKPKSEDKVAKKAKAKTKSEGGEAEVEEESHAAKPKGDNVGVVKPKSDISVNTNGIDFSRFMK